MNTQELLDKLIFSLRNSEDPKLGRNILRNITYDINKDGFDWNHNNITEAQREKAIEILLKEIEDNNIMIQELPNYDDEFENEVDPLDPNLPEVDEYLQKIEDYKDLQDIENQMIYLKMEDVKNLQSLLIGSIEKNKKWIKDYEKHRTQGTRTSDIIKYEDYYIQKLDNLEFMEDEYKSLESQLIKLANQNNNE